MPKINNIYSLTLPLPKALHKFKFRINDVFLINKKYPVMKEGENDCNFIDTSPKISTSPNHNNSDNSDIESKSSRNFDESDSSSKSNSFDFEDEDEQFYKKLKKRKEKNEKNKIFYDLSKKK